MGLFNKIKSVFSKDKDAVKYDEALTKTRKEFSTKISDLSKKYKNKIIIDSSSFRINTNKVSFIMGPNGSGKTSTTEQL